MPTPPDVRVRALLALVPRRLGLQAAARAIALGAAVAVVPFVFTRHFGVTIGVGIIAAAAHFWATRGRAPTARPSSKPRHPSAETSWSPPRPCSRGGSRPSPPSRPW
ncbi:MAG: hypothetical protein IPL75_08990 [Acidobacteria bacterium]|nr:hypothetical protein [Acidobacteriota bacterium]